MPATIRTFAELVTDLRMRRKVGDPPPVLLLGAGASVDAGIGAMPELYKFFGCADFESFAAYIDTTTAPERYRYLAEFLQTQRPAEVTPGYQALAALCAQNYFDLVLTTNMDPLLDDALAAARLWRRDYLLIVNGVIRPDRLAPLLGGRSPRVKIVKLHGDLFQRFMAWTVPEMDTFLDEVAPDLTSAVAGRDFLVVGYSLRDRRVRALVESAGGSVWFTHPERLPDHLEPYPSRGASSLRAVVAAECAFERFFPSLAGALGLDVPAAPLDAARVELGAPATVPAGALTVDDLMASTLTVMGPGGQPAATAFLLADPRVIVADAYVVASFDGTRGVTLSVGGGPPFAAKILRTARHPFGPALLAAPDALQAPGLRLSIRPLTRRTKLQALVAAGTRTGISSGRVTVPRAAPIAISPIPRKVSGLAELDLVVAGGSSGAPIVDDTLAVRGFIVAGSSDESRPQSFAYPASEWAAFLDAAGRGRPRRPRRAGRAKR